MQTVENIVVLPIEELRAYGNNPRLNDKAVDPVAESIKEFGFINPILIDKDNVIIAGHTRLKAALRLGLASVPCIRCEDLTPEQVNAYRLVDNKTAEYADWDLAKLNAELSELAVDIPELDMEKFGFFELLEIDIDDYLKDKQDKQVQEEEPERIQCPYCGEWFDKP